MTNTEPAPHDVLVHYTSAQGLEGILRSNTLWATHGGHTNDAEELQTGLKLLKQFWKTEFWNDPDFIDFIKDVHVDLDKLKEEEEKAGGPDNFWREKLGKIMDEIKEEFDKMEKYICSFSETSEKESYNQENGRLSQWRGYGDYGIVFNKVKLDKIVSTFPHDNNLILELKSVLYVDPEEDIQQQTRLYIDLRNDLKTIIKRFIAGVQSNDSPDGQMDDGLRTLIKIVFLLKNKGFEEEKEHRLLIFYYNPEALDQSNREEGIESNYSSSEEYRTLKEHEQIAIRRNRIVPYTNLFRPHDPLPIEKILIGPAPDEEQKKREAGVNALIKHLKSIGSLKNDIPVQRSKIPYRV
jgi:hypothetical protein